MSDSLTIDECHDALLSLSLPDSSRSGRVPFVSIVICQAQTLSQADLDRINYYFGTGPGTYGNSESYIDAAIRSSDGKAYIFMKDEYVLLDYSEGVRRATVREGPLPICKRFSFLQGTDFIEYGLDAAFGCGEDEAIIFCGDQCARINYGSKPSHDIKLISEMFPSLKKTRFESDLDAALESWIPNEAFLFQGNKCAIVRCCSKNFSLVRFCTISEAFPCLKGTPYACDIEAALASKITGSYEVFLFKERNWALINFGCSAGLSNPKIVFGKEVFPPLRHLLPRKRFALDRHGKDHCGCEPNTNFDDLPGSSIPIYTQEEAQRVMDAWVIATRNGREVTTADIYRELKEEAEAKANKSIIGS